MENTSAAADYRLLSDTALAQFAQEGDQRAEEALILRYRRLVRSCTRPFFLSGGDHEDLVQEGMIGLLYAVRNFRPAGGAAFRTYAELCVRRRLISAARSFARLKHSPLNDGVSLEEMLSQEQEGSSPFPLQQFRRSPEEQVLAREFENEFISDYLKNLSGFETDVLNCYLEGYSYEEIAGRCRRSVKSVDNAVQRIRRKLARQFQSGGFSES